jgi:hypothetical protein
LEKLGPNQINRFIKNYNWYYMVSGNHFNIISIIILFFGFQIIFGCF